MFLAAAAYAPVAGLSGLLVPVYDPAPAQVIRAHFNTYLITRQYTYVVHPHFAGNSSKYLMAILKTYTEHSIRQRFNYCTVLFDQRLFSHIFLGTAKVVKTFYLIVKSLKNKKRMKLTAYFQNFTACSGTGYLAQGSFYSSQAPHIRRR